MAKLQLKAGTTSYIGQIFIQDSSSTTGAGLAGLTQASSGLTAYYHRDTDTTATAITLVTMTVGTFTSSGFKEIDATNMPGWYQFCPPNAALAAGAKSCGFHLKGATNMAPLPLEVELTAIDNQDGVHGGMSALPNTAVTTNGSLLTSGTGSDQISASAGKLLLQATQSGVTIPTVTTVTNQLTAAAIATGVWQDATAGDFTAASSIGKSLYTTGNAPGAASGLALVGSAVGAAASVTGNVGGNVTGSVGSVASGGITRASLAADTGLQPIRSNTAQAGSGTTITLDASASAVDSFYTNALVLLTGGTGVGQARFISAYVGSTKVATVATWVTTPDNTTTFAVLPFDAVAGASAPTAAQVATAVWQDLLAGSDFSTVASIGKLLKDDIDAAVSSRMATFTTPTNFSSLSIDGSGRVDVAKVGGTSQTARDLGASVLISSGTGTGQLSVTSGVIDANVTKFGGTAGTFTTGKPDVQNVAGAVTGAVGSVTGNVGGSVASVTGAVGSVTGNVGGNVVGSVASVTGAVGSVTGNVGGSVASVTATVNADVKKINGTTVNGNGGVTPWGP